jgi:hypothetical protein
LGPATWGLVDVASMAGSECRVEGEQRRFVAASSMHGRKRDYAD